MYNGDEKAFKIGYYHGPEIAYIDNIKFCGSFHTQNSRKVCITYRVPVSKIKF